MREIDVVAASVTLFAIAFAWLHDRMGRAINNLNKRVASLERALEALRAKTGMAKK